MVLKLDIKWILNAEEIDFVVPLGSREHLGFIGKDLTEFTLFCLRSQSRLWTFSPSKRSNFFGSSKLVGGHIFIEEKDCKGCIWHSIEIKTGDSIVVKGLGDETYFRFSLGGYGIFDVDDKPVVIDPMESQPIEVRGELLDFSIGFGSNGNYWGFRELPALDQGMSIVGKLKIESSIAYFGKEVELRGDPSKDELSYSTHNENYIIFKYYDDRSAFCIFDWNGKLIEEVNLSSFLSGGDGKPQGMAADDGKFVFHVRNRKDGKDKFIGVDIASFEEPWLREMGMGHSVGMDKIIQVGRYIVSPIGKGGVKEDCLANGKVISTDDCVTRVLDMYTGEVNVIHDDIGEYVVGTEKGIYYRLYSDSSTLCYGEFV